MQQHNKPNDIQLHREQITSLKQAKNLDKIFLYVKRFRVLPQYQICRCLKWTAEFMGGAEALCRVRDTASQFKYAVS